MCVNLWVEKAKWISLTLLGRVPPFSHFLPRAGISFLSDPCLVSDTDGFWQDQEELLYFHGNVNSHSAGIWEAT